ncbi:MAG: acetate--CoA ligase family protein [Nitrososphaerota archaeon]|nr:acetate--CoA ligase family protein [Nitrososphaerota archaeon]MDG6943112.1 acetate--CoA ligase family protein [Nitrososphaerota archaeon]MDG6951010.1 acetate--CoA ligase family protein [Nitrososphaerota archaeon]
MHGRRGIKSFFEPKSIAVAGVSADPDKMGSIVFANLLASGEKGVLKARVYALNPFHASVAGQKAYRSISALPEVPELIVVAVPESQTMEVVEAAAAAGTRAAIIITSGYAEVGRKDIEKKIAEVAERSGMRVLGPNTIGVVDTTTGVDTLFLRPTKSLPDGSEIASTLKPTPGGVVMITQSGHLGQAIVEELTDNGVGIRALVGTGNQADVSVEEVIEYFSDDPRTTVIALYLEGLRDGREFLEVARRATRRKPLVVFKAGKTAGGARAALTHTASLVGDYSVYQAVFRQAGAVEASNLQELSDFSISLSMLPRPAGNRLVVVTNAGGVGTVATDEAIRSGLRGDRLSPSSMDKLRKKLGGPGFISNASLGNPVDLTASAGTQDFVRAVEEVTALPECDMILALPTHQAPAIGPDVAEGLIEVVRRSGKTTCMCVVGKSELAERMHKEFVENGVPSFPTPERAVRALAAAWQRAELLGAPSAPQATVPAMRSDAWKEGPLRREELADLLKVYGIREPRSVVARKEEDATRVRGLKFPVACKLLSRGLSHKTDAGGVVLGVESAEEAGKAVTRLRTLASRKGIDFEGVLLQEMVEGGVEIILGGKRDSTFGPVVVVGLGGTNAELIHEVAMAVAPVSPAWAEAMLRSTRLWTAMHGFRGGPKVSASGLGRIVSDFSRMLVEHPSLGQVEVNPLIAQGTRFFAVDARGAVLPQW